MTSSHRARGANAAEEVVGDLHGDVGLQQRRADLAEGVVHLLGVELPSCSELLEDAVQAVGQRVEHKW